MAIWQYPLRLVQKKAYEDFINSDQLDIYEYLRDNNSRFQLQIQTDALDRCLQRNKSREDDETLYWGDPSKTDVSIFYNNGIFTEALFRISLAHTGVEKYFKMALEFASVNDCVILDEENRLIRPSLDALKENLKDFPQFSFVSNPKGFLEKLQKDQTIVEKVSKSTRLKSYKVVFSILLFTAIIILYYLRKTLISNW